jgi:hypothetical protein
MHTKSQHRACIVVSILLWPCNEQVLDLLKTRHVERKLTVSSPQRRAQCQEDLNSLTLCRTRMRRSRLCKHPLVLLPDLDTTPSLHPSESPACRTPCMLLYPRCKQLISEVYCQRCRLCLAAFCENSQTLLRSPTSPNLKIPRTVVARRCWFVAVPGMSTKRGSGSMRIHGFGLCSLARVRGRHCTNLGCSCRIEASPTPNS